MRKLKLILPKHETKIRSFDEFTNALANLNEGLVLFRGQVEDWKLRPKIGRPDLVLSPGANSLLEVEKKMMRMFKRQAPPFLQKTPSSEWDWLALAEHHGMATRLLDWSSNPLIALWFAVAPKISDPKPVVWAFKPKDIDFVQDDDDPFSGQRTKVFQPFHIAERIRVQAGYFTVHKQIATKDRFIPFENIESYKRQLKKLQIVPSAMPEIRRRLNLYGINEASIFPDLDGLCHHIEWFHTFGAATISPKAQTRP